MKQQGRLKVSKKHQRWIGRIVLFAGLAWGNVTLAAQSEPIYNVYALSSQAVTEVDNDLMTATLYVQEQDKDSALLANKINAAMSWAIEELKEYPALKVQTRDYQTYPRYDTSQARRLIGWRATQSIQIETDDFKTAGRAVQALQERLLVQEIRLSAKPTTRSAAADALIIEALDAFKARATLIQQNMTSSGFNVLEVNIQTNHNNPRMYRGQAPQSDMMRSASVAEAPAIETGTSRVSVQVSGKIQLE